MIKLDNITKKYDGNIVLDDISLKFEDGKIYGIVGRNGSGKSVLLNVICGFSKPDMGTVMCDDVNIYKESIFLPNARALINKPKFIDDLSGFKNLQLLAEINRTISEDTIDNTLKNVNLYSEKDKIYKKYSLGMKQKLGIAQVIMEDPKIMLLDEPFNGLDEKSIIQIRNLLIEEKKNGKLILIATHIKDDINILCDEVLYLDGGKIINHEVINR
jgi:ABC-2 type transport system ATP-binding protein